MKTIAFDLEIAKVVPDGANWDKQHPLGISCAATLTSEGQAQLWHNGQDWATDRDGARYGDKMSPNQVRDLVAYLRDFINRGYSVVTWNGLGFDFKVLAEECEDRMWAMTVADMAMGMHIDPGFQMVCERGFMIGLDKAAKGLRVGGKTDGMHGDLAPILWSGDLSTATTEQRENIMHFFPLLEAAGTRAAQDLCLEYVGQDARATMDVYNAIVEKKKVWWVTTKGTICKYPWKPIIKQDPYDRLLRVSEALGVDEPNTSWMTDPRPRGVYFEWVEVLKRRQITL